MSLVARVKDVSLERDGNLVLDRVSIDIKSASVLVVMGPGGSGKSALLRTICGLSTCTQTSGRITLGRDAHPIYVPQKLDAPCGSIRSHLFEHLGQVNDGRVPHFIDRTLSAFPILAEFSDRLDDPLDSLSDSERRMVALGSALFASSRLVVFDEPTADLDDEAAAEALHIARTLSQTAAVVVITHNQKHARAVADKVVLVAGNSIVEELPATQFFSQPNHPATEQYLRTGGCVVDERPMTTNAAYLSSGSISYIPSAPGPRGFHWLIEGALAGCPKPGIVDRLEHDLDAIRRCGVTTLVTLTESPLDDAMLRDFGLRSLFFPIPDMHAPAEGRAHDLLRVVQDHVSFGDVVAFHCKAGLGRTGTMLAAYLIFEGSSASDALQLIRSINPSWVQSTEQEDFLESFETWLVRQSVDEPKSAPTTHPPE